MELFFNCTKVATAYEYVLTHNSFFNSSGKAEVN